MFQVVLCYIVQGLYPDIRDSTYVVLAFISFVKLRL